LTNIRSELVFFPKKIAPYERTIFFLLHFSSPDAVAHFPFATVATKVPFHDDFINVVVNTGAHTCAGERVSSTCMVEETPMEVFFKQPARE
jgi:hypothetical protein